MSMCNENYERCSCQHLKDRIAALEKDVAKHLRTMRGAVVCCAHPSKQAAEEDCRILDEALRANAIAKDAP